MSSVSAGTWALGWWTLNAPPKTRPGQLRSGLFTNRISSSRFSSVPRHIEVSLCTVDSRWYPKYPRTRGTLRVVLATATGKNGSRGSMQLAALARGNETSTNSPVPLHLAPLGLSPSCLSPSCVFPPCRRSLLPVFALCAASSAWSLLALQGATCRTILDGLFFFSFRIAVC